MKFRKSEEPKRHGCTKRVQVALKLVAPLHLCASSVGYLEYALQNYFGFTVAEVSVTKAVTTTFFPFT
jgi:hypothetical protein